MERLSHESVEVSSPQLSRHFWNADSGPDSHVGVPFIRESHGSRIIAFSKRSDSEAVYKEELDQVQADESAVSKMLSATGGRKGAPPPRRSAQPPEPVQGPQ